MYSPHLQSALAQAHVQELRRSRQTRNSQPITTNERIASRNRNAARLAADLARAIERFVGRGAPEAYAF